MKDVGSSLNEECRPLSSAYLSSDMTAASHPILSPVAVMPEQFFGLPSRSDKGEVALMYAVLEDAFHCFAQQFVDSGVQARHLAREAERWFFANDDRWPFSFVNICFVLRVNPEYVRLGLRRWRRRPLTVKRQRQHVVCRTRALRVAA
jgi:hypothetical protein